jgi:hypothetical protein
MYPKKSGNPGFGPFTSFFGGNFEHDPGSIFPHFNARAPLTLLLPVFNFLKRN